MKKLRVPKIYSQRDNRWSSTLLGYNTQSQYSIGNYGCLITSLGNYLDKTPLEVNDILKANGGFTAGSGEFIWGKCTALGINQVYVSPHYDGPMTDFGLNKIKECIDSGYPLLCEIDFNPATEGEEMHFVLLNGYDGDVIYAIDPWTGTQINLDIYGGAKRAIIQFRQYDRKLDFDTTQDASQQVIYQSDAFVALCSLLGKPIDKDIVLDDVKHLIQMEDLANQRQKDLDNKTAEAISLGIQIEKLKSDVKATQDKLNTTQSNLDSAQKEVIELGIHATDLTTQIEELKKSKPLTEYTVGDLIVQILKKITGR